jgi:RNA polymerase sigma-70 factor, ECF subfamily
VEPARKGRTISKNPTGATSVEDEMARTGFPFSTASPVARAGAGRSAAEPQAAEAPAEREPREVTRLLRAWSAGEDAALERLFPLVYDELRRTARRFLAGERVGHTLQPTALVHEVYFRLVAQRRVQWQERSQFYAIAARSMRRILVDHARGRASLKRGGEHPLPIEEAHRVAERRSDDLVALDDALTALGEIDPQKAALVELRFFGGLSNEEAAVALHCSRATVIRQWRIARAWLYHELAAPPR